ncbi:hypothetical protein CKO24_02595 [Rhodothalassium salexigens DSM 2132]|nr:hypothetical protein [Rhodothalassium salexigens DSM 2132]
MAPIPGIKAGAMTESEFQSEDELAALIDMIGDGDPDETVSLQTILESVGERGFGSMFMLLGLTMVLPLGALPGVPMLLGLVVSLVAVQLVIGRRTVWLPRRLRQLSVRRGRLQPVPVWVHRLAERIDGLMGRRMTWAAGPLGQRAAAGLCILLAASTVPLGLIPFGVAVPGLAITVFGLAILGRDGLVMIIGAAFTLAATAALAIVFL